jgi:protein phosphatase
VYLLRDRTLVQVTKDQSYLQLLIDTGKIPPDQVATYSGRNEVLHAIGRAPSVAMTVSRIELRRGDTILLCSDGLTGDVPDETIRDILSGHPPDVACAKLVDAANLAGGNDNITVVVATLSGASVAERATEGDPVVVTPLI